MYTYVHTTIYNYATPRPPPRTTARCRDTAANPPTFRLLVYNPVLKFRGLIACRPGRREWVPSHDKKTKKT